VSFLTSLTAGDTGRASSKSSRAGSRSVVSSLGSIFGLSQSESASPSRIAGITAVVGAKSCDHVLGSCWPIDHQRAQLGLCEDKPDQIPFVGRDLLKIK
jgi:hypothetical protein